MGAGPYNDSKVTSEIKNITTEINKVWSDIKNHKEAMRQNKTAAKERETPNIESKESKCTRENDTSSIWKEIVT